MTKLEAAIRENDDLVFISDRHGSIHSSIAKVFPNASHGACKYHLAQTLGRTLEKLEGVYIIFFASSWVWWSDEPNKNC